MRIATTKLAFILPAAGVACLASALVACGGSSSRTSVASTPPRSVAVSQTHTTSAPIAAPAQPVSDPAADRDRERARITALAAECDSESGGPRSRSARAQKRGAVAAQIGVSAGAKADGGAGATDDTATAASKPTSANTASSTSSEVDLLDQECASAAMTVASYDLEASSMREDFIEAADAGH